MFNKYILITLSKLQATMLAYDNVELFETSIAFSSVTKDFWTYMTFSFLKLLQENILMYNETVIHISILTVFPVGRIA